MKKLLIAAFISSSLFAFAQHNLPAASPRQSVEQQFSTTKISVDYGRPGVKGRKIFGDLVPYNKVWRAGANSSTKITFAQPVKWGAYAYDEKLNVTEITVPVQKLAEKQEWFGIELNPVDDNSVDMVVKWEQTKVTVPVKAANPDAVAKVVEKLKEIRQIERDAAAKK